MDARRVTLLAALVVALPCLPAGAAEFFIENQTIAGVLPVPAGDMGKLRGNIVLDGGVIDVSGTLRSEALSAINISGDGQIELRNGANWTSISPRGAAHQLVVDSGVEVLGAAVSTFVTEHALLRGVMATAGPGTSNQAFTVDARRLTNEGVLEARSGGFMWVNLNPVSHNLVNGTIRTQPGGTVRLSTSDLEQWADLGTFDNHGRVEVNFDVDNVGGTMELDGGEWAFLSGGGVWGGVISATPGTTVATEPYRYGTYMSTSPITFHDVTFDADVIARSHSYPTIEARAAINGDWSFAHSEVRLKGSPTITGDGRFVFRGATGDGSLVAQDGVATLPASMTLRAEAGGVGTLSKSGASPVHAWIIDAAVEADGGTIRLGNAAGVTINGVATARNGGLLVTSTSGTINNGTIRAELGGAVEFGNGVVNDGVIDVDGGALIYTGVTPSGTGSYRVANSKIYAYRSNQTLSELRSLQGDTNEVVVGWAPVNLEGGILSIANADGRRWSLYGAGFTNGTVESADGFELAIVGPPPGYTSQVAPILRGFTLNADLRLGAGRAAHIEPTLTGAGRFILDGGMLVLSGGHSGLNPVNAADIVDRIDVEAGGVVRFVNEMNNVGRTLHLKSGVTWELSVVRANGIVGGRIEADPGVELRHVQGYGNSLADLRGVTLAAPVRIASSSRGLYIRDGLTLDGGVVEVGNGQGNQFSDARLVFLGDQTLGGSGEVRFNAIPGFPSHPTWPRINMIEVASGGGGVPGGLTIGEDVTVRTAEGSGYIGGSYFYQLPPAAAALVNHGTLLAENGHTLSLFVSTFEQRGTLRIAEGSTLVVTQGIGVNDGLIDLVDGTFDANGQTYRNGSGGEIRGRGRLDFNQVQFTNDGLIAPFDAIDVLGDYTQSPTGVLQVGVTSDQAFSSDSLRIDGAATLAGALRLTYSGDEVPEVGDFWPVFTATGGISGAFTSIVADWLPDELSLLIDYQGGIVTATLGARIDGDFNADGTVDGADFLAWQRGDSPEALSPADLADWRTNYGAVTPSAPASTAVPEPSCVMLLLTVLASCSWFRTLGHGC